jgi:hypothetical protein
MFIYPGIFQLWKKFGSILNVILLLVQSGEWKASTLILFPHHKFM